MLLLKKSKFSNVFDFDSSIVMIFTYLSSIILALDGCDWLLAQNQGIPDKNKIFESVFLTKVHILVGSNASIIESDGIDIIRRLLKEAMSTGLSCDSARVAQLALWQAGDKAFEEKRYDL
jgi:hypothetical protein